MPQIATSGTAARLIPQNSQRVSLLMMNLDATDNIFGDADTKVPSSGLTTSNASIRLGPGAAISINRLTDGLAQIQDSYTFIASANTPILAWFETENFNRRTGKFEFTQEELLTKLKEMLERVFKDKGV